MALAKLQEAERLKTEVERWETGGDNKRKATVVATALSLAVAGKPAEAIAAGAASPYINEAIKHITENTDNKALEALNVPLHILWGAVEAELAGGNAKAGAIAAGVGEVGATVLAQAVYGKVASDLTTEEKANLLASAKLLAGAASGAISAGNGAETLANASVGMTVAENAVENNLFNPVFSQPNVDWATVAKGQAKEQEVLSFVYEQHPEIMEAIEVGKTVGEILINFTPVLGDAKAFYEAERAIDYALSMAGVFPIAGDAIVALKGAKSAYKAARKAELSGDIAEAQRNLQEGKNLINQYYTQINDLGDVSTNNKVKTQLKTELAFKEADILNVDGTLTKKAIADSSIIPLSDGVIRNPEIVKALTRDGSKIEDWNKDTTQSIKLSNGQSMQIHYYKNEKTGKVDYDTKDFKVKGVVKSW